MQHIGMNNWKTTRNKREAKKYRATWCFYAQVVPSDAENEEWKSMKIINFVKRLSHFSPVLPLVTYVKWGEGACSAPSGETGSCLPASDCQLRGGIAGGQCAGGYGICCVFMGKFRRDFICRTLIFLYSKLRWRGERKWNILCES